jgi:hypothetical protein
MGDRGNLKHWLTGNTGFDLWVAYYGEVSGRYKELADYYFERKGSKFQNLHFAYKAWPEIFQRYDAVMVIDDDVLISGTSLTRLFQTRAKYDLWVLQPAFSLWGKISWPITAVHPGSFLRYTNFVEMTCPLFKREKLEEFLRVYDPVLVGWGMDWWFLQVLGPDLAGKVAVVDQIPCINPHDRRRPGGQREIDQLQTTAERRRIWEQVRLKYNITSEAKGFQEYGFVPAPLFSRVLSFARFHGEALSLRAIGLARRLVRYFLGRER